MKNISRRAVSAGLAATALAPFARSASAQAAYPGGRAIKAVVPFAAGGATDVIGRIIADRMQAKWNTSVVVENVSGGGANIGMDRVAKGPADGSQILVVAPQIAINQYLYAKLAYDPEKDLMPIAQVANVPNILVVRKDLPVNSVQELIAYAKANPGKLNYASSGNGTTVHLSAELFKRMAGVDIKHIPYRGSAPAVNDLLAGQVDLMFDNATSIIGQVRGGTVKALAITTSKPFSQLPDLPPVAQTVPGYDTVSWFGIVVRAGTPDAIAGTIEEAVRAAVQEPAVKERLAALIAEPVLSDRKSFADFIADERKKWGPLIADLNIRID
ncbi:Bug family tripartite tricarboxylate transporter substrate binding protein [Pseudorhodoplanes sinuspersici]|nr:tripartite tricarboxylate transporter substrate binding protein [Pseudorhodoplanes sinuspersici]RKE69191.1 tripartite-type tricarboxylate transporter receptor subunit TctC [Pseudorhodoplanes sinuspersici]